MRLTPEQKTLHAAEWPTKRADVRRMERTAGLWLPGLLLFAAGAVAGGAATGVVLALLRWLGR